MNIIIISDVHDNLANLEKCLGFAVSKKAEKIIFCGDLTNDETLVYLASGFPGEIHMVSGNVELYAREDADNHKNIIHYGRIGRAKFGDKYIGFCHEPYLFDYVLKKGKCGIVFYGHTHKPWTEIKQGVPFVNPGTVAGTLNKATFAFFDTEEDEPELIVVDNL